jgi:hypothetical protein
MGRPAIDIIGKRFGKLVVIKRDGSIKRDATWLCRCDCGNKCINTGSRLRSGYIKSCGCLRFFPKGDATFNILLSVYKKRAKRRGFEFELTKEQFCELTKQNCHYCNAMPSQRTRNRTANGDYIYNGLDRIDTIKGYTIDNVVPCCKDCNYAKRKMSIPRFKFWVQQIFEHFGSK